VLEPGIIFDPFLLGGYMSDFDKGYIRGLRDAVVMANETSDNQGNLYRIDYINRLNHEIALMTDYDAGLI
jgi:hypothetical protein